MTAASRAQQIQALTLLRTLDQWQTRTPYPEQPVRLARLAKDLVTAVLGDADALAVELRTELSTAPEHSVGGAPVEAAGASALRVCLACRRCESNLGVCSECSGPLTYYEASSVVDGRYVLTGELGRGAIGVVHEAIDVFLERAVALKVIATPETFTGTVLTSFRREAAALAAIRNDHVVQVYTFGVHGKGYYLAMERVVGRNLESILEEHAQHDSTLPVPLSVNILARVASGLAAAHDAGVLHRDVKPANIVIEDRTGRAVLIDFGLALRKHFISDLRERIDLAGTPLYLAPELAGGVAQAPRDRWNASDIYALGCTAFEMLTGRPPFVADSIVALLEKHRTAPPPRPSALRPGLAPFDEALVRALAKDPGERPPTALQLAQELEQALQVWLSPEPTLPTSGRFQVRPSSPPAAPVVVTETDGYPEGARVLIVDDDEVFRRLATRCAELAFFQCPVRIEAAASSEAAITCATNAMPDLVVLDYSMPGEDGVTTLTRLRRLPGGDRARVIVASASVAGVERWRFEGLGVTDFLSKPVRFQAFIELIADIAARAGWQNALMARPPRAGA